MTKPDRRPYRKRRRAEAEEETRQRITEAAVELHGTVGPVNSTVTEVAKRAGVSRMTVYNHFPTEVDLFAACSSHWASRNPFPDPSRWMEVTDPWERLGSALEEMYGWYDRKQQMLGNVLRDVPVVPALAEVMDELWTTYMTNVVGALAEGVTPRTGGEHALRASLRLAVDFNTWRTLTESGLGNAEAAEAMTRMVGGATAKSPRGATSERS
jgi:AcrR family transcriptional regulator